MDIPGERKTAAPPDLGRWPFAAVPDPCRISRPAEVPAPQHRAALAPEQQPLRTGAGVLLQLGPEFLDEEVRQGDVPDAGHPLARKAKGVPRVTPTRT